MKFVLLAIFTLITAVSPAMGRDISLMKNLVGKYPIQDLNGTTALTGILEVLADDQEGVGFRLTDVVGENDVNGLTIELVSPVTDTKIATEGDAVVQEFKATDYSLRVEYRSVEGQVQIHSVRCPVNAACELTLVNMENAPVESVDPARFFSEIAGGYRIELVGGEAPHDGNDTADVSASGGEANLTFPYCPNAGGLCDPGYIDLAFGSTKVTRKLVSPGRYLYTIQSSSGRYTWEERGGKVYFRNYQYRLASGRVVVLTHVMKKI